MGNKLFCSDDKKVAANSNSNSNKKNAMIDVEEEGSDSHSHSITQSPVNKKENKTIPSDRTVDYPLQVFERLANSKQLPVFDDTNSSIDYLNHDYRAFGLLLHKKHGAILLHCTRKKQKPPHYQLPGGHVDAQEFEAVLGGSNKACCTPQQLFLAARAGCAREIYEETTIDLRSQEQIDRLLPLIVRRKDDSSNSDTSKLCNEFKDRLFFVAQVLDSDFPSSLPVGSVRYQSVPQGGVNCNLMLQLSVEHSDFKFATSPQQMIQDLHLHSGGKVSKALAKAYNVEGVDKKDSSKL